MPLPLAQALATAFKCYVAVGVVFALAFAWRGAGAVDPAAKRAGLGFRLLILPGSAALWPWMLAKWRRASRTGPRAASESAPDR